jgi:hypothetical protein
MHTKGSLTKQEATKMVNEGCVAALDNAEWVTTGRVLPGQDGMDCNDDDYVSEFVRTVACVPYDEEDNCCTLSEYVYATTAQCLAEEWPETTGFEIY